MRGWVLVDYRLLAAARCDRGWSLRDVARRMRELGAGSASPQSVLNHESGARRPYAATAVLYARVFGLDLGVLVRGR